MKIKILLLTFSFTALIGCSSDYDDAKTYLKCGIAARHLEQFKGLDKIQQKLDRFNNLQLLTPRDIAMMAEETREEIGLSNGEYSDFWKLLKLTKIYNSSECTEIHEQPEIPAGWLYYLLYPFL